MLSGLDIYYILHICFFLAKQINKQFEKASADKNLMEEELNQANQQL